MPRPLPDFHGYYGQPRPVAHVRRLSRGARSCGEATPSLMLLGPSGIGKTSFANAIAVEVGVEPHMLVAARSVKTRHLVGALTALHPGDLFLIDEAHSLGVDEQQLLFRALDEWQAPVVENGKIVATRFQPIPPFCLVLATNRPGKVLPALRRRLHRLEFRPYTLRELTFIARRVGENKGLDLTAQAARQLAEVAHGSPASIEKRLVTLRLCWTDRCRFSRKHIERILRLEGIDRFGLSPGQRTYIRVLAASPRARNTLRRLSVHLGCDTRYVADDVEPGLIFQGYVDANEGPRRQLTAKGRDLVKALDVEKPNDQERTDEDK